MWSKEGKIQTKAGFEHLSQLAAHRSIEQVVVIVVVVVMAASDSALD